MPGHCFWFVHVPRFSVLWFFSMSHRLSSRRSQPVLSQALLRIVRVRLHSNYVCLFSFYLSCIIPYVQLHLLILGNYASLSFFRVVIMEKYAIKNVDCIVNVHIAHKLDAVPVSFRRGRSMIGERAFDKWARKKLLHPSEPLGRRGLLYTHSQVEIAGCL